MTGVVKEISLGDGFGDVALKVNGATVEVHKDGSVAAHTNGDVDAYTSGAVHVHAPANDIAERLPDLAAGRLAQKVLEVGDRLRDGTVCIAVDLKNNKALFAPAGIIGGNAKFDDQHEIPAQLNKQNTHGYSDWRNITDAEGKTLSEVWDKVAPDELKARAAPWFWLASPDNHDTGRVRRGGEAYWLTIYRYSSLPVPCVRTGPAVG